MENQDSRLYREWPNVDLEGFRATLLETISKRKLRYMDDVAVEKPAKGQCLLYNGERWIAGSVSPTGDVQVTDHGSLTGLTDDTHPQYLNRERALESFYAKVDIDDFLSGKADINDLEDLRDLVEQINNKPAPTLEDLGGADINHNHNDLYYTKDEVNTSLSHKADSNKSYSHASLTDLESDDHKQYLNEARGDLRYFNKQQINQLLDLKSDVSRVSDVENRLIELENKPDQGVTSHTDLTDLESDDHPQYLNQDRGDLRYYTKSEVNNSLSSKVDTLDVEAIKNRVNQLESRPVFDGTNYYTKTQINNSLSSKASNTDVTNLTTKVNNLEGRQVFDSSLYFTKVDINSLLNGKTNIADTISLVNRVGVLESKTTFDPTSYYTKTNVDDLLSVKADISNYNALSARASLLESYNYPLSEYGIHSTSAPLQAALSGATMTNGKMWLTRVQVPANMAINKVMFYVRTIGSMPGTATSGVAVYSNTGTLLGSVLSNALFTSLGWKTATLTTGIAAQSAARFVWIGVICNFSTIPALSGLTATPVNGGATTTHRRNISITATNTFPASFTPASYGANEDILPLLCLGA